MVFTPVDKQNAAASPISQLWDGPADFFTVLAVTRCSCNQLMSDGVRKCVRVFCFGAKQQLPG